MVLFHYKTKLSQSKFPNVYTLATINILFMFKSEDDVIYIETQCNHLKLKLVKNGKNIVNVCRRFFQKHVMITRGDYVSRIQNFVAS